MTEDDKRKWERRGFVFGGVVCVYACRLVRLAWPLVGAGLIWLAVALFCALAGVGLFLVMPSG